MIVKMLKDIRRHKVGKGGIKTDKQLFKSVNAYYKLSKELIFLSLVTGTIKQTEMEKTL